MGTTLTGTTPQDTYDSLIKVTDNGPLSGTAKYLSDGLGNDSALALSTGNIGIGMTNPTVKLEIKDTPHTTVKVRSGSDDNILFLQSIQGADSRMGTETATPLTLYTNGNEQIRITSAGNVGIGTTSPALSASADITDLTVTKSGRPTNVAVLNLQGDRSGDGGAISRVGTINFWQASNNTSRINGLRSTQSGSGAIAFETDNASSGLTERMQITSEGYVRLSSNSGGIQFNGDTAAANALDDYEEGTFTPSISFGGLSTGITYAFAGATYTKVGRKVTLNGYIALSNKGSATGNARIEGAPFTVLAGDNALSATTLWYNNVTYTGSYQAFFRSGTTYAELTEVTEAGAISALQETDFANNSEVIFSVTYFV